MIATCQQRARTLTAGCVQRAVPVRASQPSPAQPFPSPDFLSVRHVVERRCAVRPGATETDTQDSEKEKAA